MYFNYWLQEPMLIYLKLSPCSVLMCFCWLFYKLSIETSLTWSISLSFLCIKCSPCYVLKNPMLDGINPKLVKIGGKSSEPNTSNYLITQCMEIMNSCSPRAVCFCHVCCTLGIQGRRFATHATGGNSVCVHPQRWGKHLFWGWTAAGFTLAVSEAICARGRELGCHRITSELHLTYLAWWPEKILTFSLFLKVFSLPFQFVLFISYQIAT